jgi:SRSO17 transposase
MALVRPVIEEFAGRVLGGFARRDQRVKGELYLGGLMLDGKRKSMQPMAERLGVDHQQLQQFVSTSTWDHLEVRRRLALWAREFVDPRALVIDDTGFPKDGKDSPGVARMYCGALGKTGNCQIGVSVHAVTGWASAAIDWRLFLPESWDDEKVTDERVAAEIRRRRERSAIPQHVRHREKWRLALDMLDEVIGEWGFARRPVVADAGYGDAAEFRLGVTERGLAYVLAVSPTATAHLACAVPVTPAWTGTGRPSGPRYPDKPVDLKTLVMQAGRAQGRFVVWRHGSRKTPGNPTASMRSRFLALRVRPANRNIDVCGLGASFTVCRRHMVDTAPVC